MSGSRSSGAQTSAFLLLLFSLASPGGSTAQVPVLMWSTDGLAAVDQNPEGHITSMDQLTSYLTSTLRPGPHTLLLFLQDKLSKDDFTVFGNKEDGVFKHLQEILSSSSSVTLPAVEWSSSSSSSSSSSILSVLQEVLSVPPLLVDADTLSHLSLNSSRSNLLLINLPYCSRSGRSCREVLQENDQLMGRVHSIMKEKHLHYSCIYTGLQPSLVVSDWSQQGSVGRSLLQSAAEGDVAPPIVFSGGAGGAPCILLWADALNVSFSAASGWTNLSSQTPSLEGSMCNDSASLLVLTYTSGTTLRFSMTQRFYPVSARNWFTLDTVELQSGGESARFSGNRSIYAPAEYSFHCQSVSSFSDPLLVPLGTAEGNASNWRLNFVDFQIQGFGVSNGSSRFSYASDCAAFFTAGLWMGLLTSLLMLLILLYGLHMILQLSTMDRFDDPKGPSIAVPQSE